MHSIMASKSRRALIIEAPHRSLRPAFRKWMPALLCLLPWLWGGAAAEDIAAQAAPIVVSDDTGRQVNLAVPAQRIISLAPSMTELLFSIGAGDRIVGVMAHSDYPPQARDIPVVGQHDLLDMEGILALQADLIVSWQTGNPSAAVQRLQQLGLNVYIAEPASLASIAGHIEKLAELTGLQEQGSTLAREFRHELEEIASSRQGLEEVSVFYQVWHSPLISVGGDELINDMIRLCGGRNIFEALPVGPKVGIESVLEHDPQVIIASGMDARRPAWLDEWRNWPHLRAVRQEQLYFIPPDLMQRHSLRALEGARQLCGHLQQVRRNAKSDLVLIPEH